MMFFSVSSVYPKVLFRFLLIGAIGLGWIQAGFAQATTTKKQMDQLWGETSNKNTQVNKDYQWYPDSKFAMFIHWGLYSNPAGVWEGKHYFGISEWLMNRAKIPVKDYEKLAASFNPVRFDADAIAQLAVDAGMKYIVITSKHHDGFAMFQSKASSYNVVDATPYGKDPIKQLAEACKRHGLKLGFYYSQSQDWHEKDAIGNDWDFKESEKNFENYLYGKVIPQVREILTQYGEVGLIWFDTPQGISEKDVVKLKELVESLQPNCLINSRIGQGLGDFETLGDSQIPDYLKKGLWESIDTHNNSWAYSVLDNNWKTDTEIIDRFIRVLCKGGNFMFNIGPKGDGSVPEESLTILREVGKWVHRNSEAIYNSRPVDMGNQVWIEATQKPGKTFLFIREWPTDGRVWLPGLKGQIEHASFLVNAQPLSIGQSGKDYYLQVPSISPDPKATVIVLEHSAAISFNAKQWVVPSTPNELLAVKGKRKGVEYTEKVRWMEIFGDWQHYPILHEWDKKGSSAEWEFYTPEAGQYILEIEYSCDADSDLKEGLIGIDGDMRTFVPVYTGDTWGQPETEVLRPMPRYMTRRLGLINISEKGNHSLKIQLDDEDNGGWIRLTKIKLTPAI
jgi:alpha-L-fucosidase